MTSSPDGDGSDAGDDEDVVADGECGGRDVGGTSGLIRKYNSSPKQ